MIKVTVQMHYTPTYTLNQYTYRYIFYKFGHCLKICYLTDMKLCFIQIYTLKQKYVVSKIINYHITKTTTGIHKFELRLNCFNLC